MSPHGLFALIRALSEASRSTKRALAALADIVFIPAVMWAAIALKKGEAIDLRAVVPELLAAVLLSLLFFSMVGLYRAVIRYIGPRAAIAVASGVLLVIASMLVLVQSNVLRLDIPTLLIFGTLLLVYVGGSRMTARWMMLSHVRGRARVVIYGAGSAGVGVATALATSEEFRPVAFVDENPALQGSEIFGLKVLSPERLPEALSRYNARRVLLALPRLSRRHRSRILEQLEPLGVHVQTVPSVSSMAHGNARVADIQEVDVADLLGRDVVPPNQQLLDGSIRGKVVLVTGAGGSIGSELCRQIIRLGPKRLLLLEMSELALYTVERELRGVIQKECRDVDLLALLGNAHHKYRVREILQTFQVDTIYHAAAYKHVPIVEHNIIEGLHNNVYSTWYTAEAALECKVSTFVLISTDKAVNPTNVMGATKRFAEIVLQGLQQRTTSTRFGMVRFGNVLESSGSVVPLFREQIKQGGPVTVTHPDVIRYFMTIPEAAQLVLQAGSMVKGGDVFVLDMGKPVRIADLARRMIQLSGLAIRDEENSDGDIEIRFTGLRPAEKLFEELLIGKNVAGTDHPMILRAFEHALPWDDVLSMLEELGTAMRRFDCSAARDVLARAVREYSPSEGIQDLVWVRRRATPGTAGEGKITELQSRRPRPAPT